MTSLTKNRIESIDLLKGLVMVIMALDHTRDYFHYATMTFDIENPALTTLPIFLTRWITHFCAPAFSFLAGLSAFMVGKKKSPNQLSGFLITRGLWLVFIELTFVTFAWTFNIQFNEFLLLVIWSLGISMIVLAALIHLPRKFLLFFCCLLIFGHNLLDNVHFNGNLFWSMLHEPNSFNLSANKSIWIGYPIVPWIAVMAFGYYCGSFYNASFDSLKRKRIFNIIGLTSITLFLILRWSNLYGDPTPWKHYNAISKNLISFMNPNKYPPSLLYLLMTLGATFLFLANSENLKGKIVTFFSTFGRVPFFYYILHLYLIHSLALLFAQPGYIWQLIDLPHWAISIPKYHTYGFNLIIVYIVWISVIMLLYPLCKKFDTYKQNHKEKWWLSYL